MTVRDSLYAIKKHSDGTTTYLISGSDKEYKSLDDLIITEEPKAQKAAPKKANKEDKE